MSFETFGDPYPFEDLEVYHPRRIVNRSDRPRLERYLTALGAPIDGAPDWPGALVVALRWRPPPASS